MSGSAAVAVLVAACVAFPARAEAPPPGYRAVARDYGLPSEVLYAVALTESGRRLTSGSIRPWPWTLNVEGRAEFYGTREEAFRALKRYLARGITRIDVGLMQVNWRYHRALLRDPWTALDPYYNLRLGAWLLAGHWHKRRDLWEAIGRYHAPAVPQRAAAYRERVSRWFARLAPEG